MMPPKSNSLLGKIMKQADSWSLLPSLFQQWLKLPAQQGCHPNQLHCFSFMDWIESKGHGDILKFRSSRGALAEIEDWFDKERDKLLAERGE
jgi:hypothetical protein